MKKIKSSTKFIILLATSIVGLLIMFFLSLYFGAEKNINFVDIINSLFRFNDEIFNEVIVRNITAGSFCKRYGVEEGIVLDEPIFELSYKNDAYGDPMLNDDHAVAMKLATREELQFLRNEALKINEIMKEFFLKMNLKLVDFKLEFGKDSEGNIILADEVSPDTCRLWDVDTNEKLDKDRFRRNLGDLVQGYEEVLARMSN